MLPDRVSNPGPLTYESHALPTALRGPNNLLTATIDRHLGRVVRAAKLWCRKSPEGSEFETGLHHLTAGKLSLLIQQ